jgi:hypothetical protein
VSETRLRGSMLGSSEGKKRAVGDSAGPAGACSGGKSGLSRAGVAYNAPDRGQIGNSSYNQALSYDSERKRIEAFNLWVRGTFAVGFRP